MRRILLRAAEANQLSETLIGLDAAESTNAAIAGCLADRARVEEAVREAVPDPSLVKTLLEEGDRAYHHTDFPYARDVVEIVPVLPDEDLDFPYADYRPERSRALMEQGARTRSRFFRY